MNPHSKSFEEWRLLHIDSEPRSRQWWETLDNMRITARYSDDWIEYARILEYDGFPVNHPEYVIATNGILFAPDRKFESLPLPG